MRAMIAKLEEDEENLMRAIQIKHVLPQTWEKSCSTCKHLRKVLLNLQAPMFHTQSRRWCINKKADVAVALLLSSLKVTKEFDVSWEDAKESD